MGSGRHRVLAWGAEEAAAQCFEALGFGQRDFGACRALWAYEGDPLGVVVVHDWNPETGTVEVSAAASEKYPMRAAARIVADYAFIDMDCQAIIARTDARNLRVRRIAKSIGATEHIIPRLRGRAASEAILVLTDEAWRKSRWRKP